MNRVLGGRLLFVVVACVASAPNLLATEGAAGTRPDAPPMTQATLGTKCDAVSRAALAYSLIDYGREHKSPLALMNAAEILHQTQMEELKLKPATEPVRTLPSAVARVKPRRDVADDDPCRIKSEDFLTEARRYGKGSPHITDMVRAVRERLEETQRGAVGSARFWVGNVPAFSIHVFAIEFEAASAAKVAVRGDGDTLLELRVYDRGGELVGKDSGTGILATSWLPRKRALIPCASLTWAMSSITIRSLRTELSHGTKEEHHASVPLFDVVCPVVFPLARALVSGRGAEERRSRPVGALC